MKKRGFAPFSTAGFLIVMMVVAVVGHAAWFRHQQALGAIEDSANTGALTILASVQNDLQHAARYAVYRALWDVSKRASDYNSDEVREREIERLAAEYLAEHLVVLPQSYEHLNAHVELRLDNTRLLFDLKRAQGGYVIAEVKLPQQTRVTASSPNNGLTIALPYTNFEVWIDSRYFLLQERMNRFIKELDDVESSWRWAEYAAAWGGAYLGGCVRLSESRSKTLFQLAWAGHELETFGSSDYLATSKGLSELSTSALSGLFETDANVKLPAPIDVRSMEEFINQALEAADKAAAELLNACSSIEHATNHLAENVEDSRLENAHQKLEDSIASIGRAQHWVKESHRQFQLFLNSIAQPAKGNAFLQQLYGGLTNSKGRYPSLVQRVSLGIEGTRDKLEELESWISACMQELQSLDRESARDSLRKLYERANSFAQSLLAEPGARTWIEYDEYPGPSDYDPNVEPKLETRKAGIYIVERNDGTIGALRIVLRNIKADLGRLEKIAGLVPTDREETQLDEGLKNKLLETLNSQPILSVNREELYEVFPPVPLKSQPGLSVFHEFDIKSVKYRREDPVGWFSSSKPTPIYLWFMGLTLYWAQWDVTLELEEEAIERVSDFDNPTLPRPLLKGSNAFANVHKPLGYRFEVPQKRFGFRLVIISPRHFNIDVD